MEWRFKKKNYTIWRARLKTLNGFAYDPDFMPSIYAKMGNQLEILLARNFQRTITIGWEILDIFQKAYSDAIYLKIIYKLYFALQNIKGHHASEIKAR